MDIEEQRRREEAMDAIQFAAMVSKDLRTTDSMTLNGSTISRTKTIDPRLVAQKLLPGTGVQRPQQPRPNVPVQRPQQPVSNDQAVDAQMPTFIKPPAGMSLTAEDFIPPELRKTPVSVSTQNVEVQNVATINNPTLSQEGQLELSFGPTTIKDIHERLDSLHSKIDEVLFILKKQYDGSIYTPANSNTSQNQRTARNEPDKKKSGTPI